jgi:hypothetical protein
VQTPQSQLTLPQGNAPQQLVDASQGNVAALTFAPTPADQLRTPLTQSVGTG